MKISSVLILAAYALGMTGGQLLFKASADGIKGLSGMSLVIGLATNVWFIAAITLYMSLTVVWVWILTFIPLSRAYPFVILAFIFTPLGAAALFGESLRGNYLWGMAFVLTGLTLIVVDGKS